METAKQVAVNFVLCIENKDCDDLEKGKVYQLVPDSSSAEEGYLRVVDESGEDYLYPESYFVAIELPEKVQIVLRKREGVCH